MILVFAGRRVDPPDAAVTRFPLAAIPMVRDRIRQFLRQHGPTAVVGAAACGSDLLVLDEASALHIDRHIVLPCGRDRFKQLSVMDRPGDWDEMYRTQCMRANSKGKITSYPVRKDKDPDYARHNERIIAYAQELGQPLLALMVWDGHARGPDDITANFAALARKQGIEVISLSSLE